MTDNIYRNFTLDNSLSAVSAVVLENSTLATDGHECTIHELNINGNYNCRHRTTRAYRRLRDIGNNCNYTALGCCNSARIYFLNSFLRETDYTELDTTCKNSCSCSCGCDDFGELTDGSLTTIGGELYIIGAFRKSAYLFDMNGKRLTRICETEGNEILTDFISVGNDTFAMGTLCGNTQTITVSANGDVQTANLNRNHTLRMLIPDGDEIYGLFGHNYIYNRIIKIYSNGILTLPK